jgi:hypothetical protein
MRNYGVPQFLDVTGNSPTTITPGAAPTLVEFLVQAPKSGVGDNWPLGMAYVVAAGVTIDQGAAGALINWENWFGSVFDSFNVENPLLGTTHERTTYQAMAAKHIIEFMSRGYAYGDGARGQIAAADADYPVYVYQTLPMAHELNERPHHSAFWLGWLNATKVQAYMAASTAPASYSTGAVFETATVRCWIEYVVSDELVMPVLNHWKRYEDDAGSKATHFIKGVGTANGLNDVLDGSRIVALLELCNGGGAVNWGGASTALNFTSYGMPQLSQEQTTNVDAYFNAFHTVVRGAKRVGHTGTAAAGVPQEDVTGASTQADPVGVVQTSPLNHARQMYIPVRAPGVNFQLTKQPKFFGDLKRIATFTAAPSSGKMVFLLNEFRELGDGKKKQMIAMTGRPGRLDRIFTNPGPMVNRTSTKQKQAGKGREAVLAERVLFG